MNRTLVQVAYNLGWRPTLADLRDMHPRDLATFMDAHEEATRPRYVPDGNGGLVNVNQ